MIRGIRGAVKIKENIKADIKDGIYSLIKKMMALNKFALEDIAGVFFTVTKDLNAEFPAMLVREFGAGWELLPCLSSKELEVPGAMENVIRVLALVNTDKKPEEIQHVYLGETSIYRPEVK